MTVRAVVFDWGGTLTPWHTVDPIEQWRAFARGLVADDRRSELLAGRMLQAEADAWARSREQHSSTRIEQILAAAGLTAGQARDEAAREAYESFWEPHTWIDPQVRPLWLSLHEHGIGVGVLSNTIWTRQYHRGLFARDGVLELLDADVYSSEIDWAKPHPEAFRAAARALDVPPEDCVYVGDRLFEDVYGAQQAGMRAILIPHSAIPAEQAVPTDARPDAVAHRLGDVAGIVQQWCR